MLRLVVEESVEVIPRENLYNLLYFDFCSEFTDLFILYTDPSQT